MIDIHLLPINSVNNTDQGPLPGMIALAPPRKTARGRENDLLILLVNMSGAEGVSGFTSWLQKKAEAYYQIAGTATFAMKTLVEALNSDLLQRNLKRAKEGSRLTAALSLAVLRRNSLYAVNVGTGHSYFSNAEESVEFTDPDTSRGLGVDEKLTCRFSQREVKENDILVMTCQPPSVWKADSFAGCNPLSLEAVNRRLFNQITGDVQCALLRFSIGKGSIKPATLNRMSIPPIQATTKLAVSSEPQTVEKIVDAVQPTEPASVVVTEPPREEPLKRDEAQVETRVMPNQQQSIAPKIVQPERVIAERPRRRGAETRPQTSEKASQVKVKVGKVTQKAVSHANRFSSALAGFIQKILPGVAEEPAKLSRNTLIGIAVGVPLVVLLIASLVYMRTGRTKEFDQNLSMAQQYAAQAEIQLNDPPLRLASLQQSIFWLDKAESYGSSEGSQALRSQVQAQLDVLEGIQRLEMTEVIPGGLEGDAKIVQMAATVNDLYLLDETSGKVQRYYMEGSSYRLDEAFDCGPNPDNPLNMLGNLVDMVPINVNNSFKATLLAVDAAGNIEFCIPGDAGVTSSLTPPDQGWMQLTSLSYSEGYLYILDSGGRAVYRYEGNGILFETKPTLFFDNQIPEVTNAIDIEVNGDELYILRSNGQMVECTYSHMKDYKLTECQDPAPYGDMRTGQVPEAITFPEANFIQMRMTAAPDSSIYLLDATSRALFHFSWQRNLQKILHPRSDNGIDLDRLTLTAVAVSPARMVFLAYGSQLYYAALP